MIAHTRDNIFRNHVIRLVIREMYKCEERGGKIRGSAVSEVDQLIICE